MSVFAANDAITEADRGFRYGDGVFETMAVRDGRIPLLAYHLDRLAEGAERLRFRLPERRVLASELEGRAAGHERSVFRLTAVRAGPGRGYAGAPDADAVLRLSENPWPPGRERLSREGVAVRTCGTRLAANPALAGLKHLARLEQVMARLEWTRADPWHEGLMLDDADRVVEATTCNLFVVRGGILATPSLERCGVRGVMRRWLMEHARSEGSPVECTDIQPQQLLEADGVFLCNSVVGIWPVRRLDDTELPVPERTRDLVNAVEDIWKS